MKPEYRPINTGQKLGYLVEECDEVLAAVGKTQRWGLDSFNPEPGASRETNREWILRELVAVTCSERLGSGGTDPWLRSMTCCGRSARCGQ